MTDSLVNFLSEPIIMLFLGVASHFLKELANMRKLCKASGTPYPTLPEIVSDYWVSILSMSIGALVGLVVLSQSGQMTAVNAFGLGYIANSVGTLFSKRAERVLGGTP